MSLPVSRLQIALLASLITALLPGSPVCLPLLLPLLLWGAVELWRSWRRGAMACCGSKTGPVVVTAIGAVEGSLMKTVEGTTIYAYRGVPYAKPPVGKLRFKKPEPALPWASTLDCRQEAKKCLQPNVLAPDVHRLAVGGDDCLYLSVFTKCNPEKESKSLLPDSKDSLLLLPVFVFLHGGAFVVGSCETVLYGPQVLLDRDVLLVGVNYRLGPLGWLSLQSEAAPGNLGLWDQRMALLWVRDNITAFGGDPGCVTLLGESAGAMSAMLHMVAPASAGLFHRVVALSGTPNNLLLNQSRQPRVYARAFAEKLGCEKDAEDEAVVEYLQGIKPGKLLTEFSMFLDWDFGFPMPWLPAVDAGLKEPFLPLSFCEAVAAGAVAKVPLIMGCCQDEGLILSSPYYKDKARLELLTRDWDTWAPLLFLGRERELVGELELKLVREVKDHYWPDGDMGTDIEEDMEKLKDIYSMSYFMSSMDTDSKLLASAGLPVFTFLLTQPAAFSLSILFSLSLSKLGMMFTKHAMGISKPKPRGVGHGDDLSYIFPMTPPFFPPSVVTPSQQKTRQILLDLLESFAMSGRPSTAEGSQAWTPLDPSLGEYFEVGEETRMTRNQMIGDQLEFWQRVKEREQKGRPALSADPHKTFYTKIAHTRH